MVVSERLNVMRWWESSHHHHTRCKGMLACRPVRPEVVGQTGRTGLRRRADVFHKVKGGTQNVSDGGE
jgi:hypothetical protein